MTRHLDPLEKLHQRDRQSINGKFKSVVGNDELSVCPHAQRLIFLDATDSLHLIVQHGCRKANVHFDTLVYGMLLCEAVAPVSSRFACAVANT